MTDNANRISGMIETCAVKVPVVRGIEPDKEQLLTDATEALSRLCAEHGMKAIDVRLASEEPWTEPLGEVGPRTDMDLYTYNATAHPLVPGDNVTVRYALRCRPARVESVEPDAITVTVELPDGKHTVTYTEGLLSREHAQSGLPPAKPN